jgi:hypothetical protein
LRPPSAEGVSVGGAADGGRFIPLCDEIELLIE